MSSSFKPSESLSTTEPRPRSDTTTLLQLRELQYYMRYGDYVKIIPTRSRIHASESKTENWQLLCGRHYWSAIADRLEEEDKQRKQARANGRNMDNVCLDTHIAVRRACTDLGVSEELAFRSILEYATRNTQSHRDLGEMREKGKFALLARTLWTDREVLDFTFSEFTSETDTSFLRHIVQNEIDTSFDPSLDSTYPDVWQPREALRKMFHRGTTKEPDAPLRRSLSRQILRKTNGARDEKTVRQKVASVAGSSAAGKKRVASTEEARDSEMEREGRRKGKASRNRLGLLARRYKLEEEFKKI